MDAIPFSLLSLQQALALVPATDLVRWNLSVPPHPPSDVLIAVLERLQFFDLSGPEAGKILLIDALLAEAVPPLQNLKVWKAAPLRSEAVYGIADYLIAPRRAYVEGPLLCVIEAKKDDFDAGRIQCIAEMTACLWNNRQKDHNGDVYGIVSNGQGWVFYQLTQNGQVRETELIAISDLPRLLGTLYFVCAECAKNAPPVAIVMAATDRQTV